MTDKDDGGPAFPITLEAGSGQHRTDFKSWPGMTLRQWYAGKALAHIYTHHDANPGKVAEWAFQVADAMIAAERSA